MIFVCLVFLFFQEELLKAIGSVVSKCRWGSLQNSFSLGFFLRITKDLCCFYSVFPFFLTSSAELQKPCAGQPTISEVLELVLKECRKESLVYKMAAVRCAGDVLHSSQEDRFSVVAEILFPLIKKVQSHIIVSYRPFVTVAPYLKM